MSTCPLGRGALATVPQLTGDPYKARQPSVSGPKINDMVAMMKAGTWNWASREIQRNGDVIINGHHRYIAARIAGIEPIFVLDSTTYSRTFEWGQLYVDSIRWPGGY